MVGNFARTGFGFGGFAALVALAIAAYLISRNDDDHPLVAPRQAPGPQPPAFYGPPVPGAYGQTAGTAYAATAPTAPTQPIGLPTCATRAAVPGLRAAAAATVDAAGPPRPRSPLGLVTFSLALVAAGALVAWNLATTHDVPAEVVFATCLGVVGLGLVVGAFAGRARGLIALGAVLVVATSIAGISHVGLRGGVGDRTWTPRTVASVHDTYRLGVGHSTLDLSLLSFAPGETVDVRVRQGVGDVTIVLPDGCGGRRRHPGQRRCDPAADAARTRTARLCTGGTSTRVTARLRSSRSTPSWASGAWRCVVRRHETDAVSLVAGLLFLVVAVVHIAARSTGTDLNLRWMLPAVLVLLGVLGLLGAIRSPRGAATGVAEPAELTEPPVPDEAAEAATER